MEENVEFTQAENKVRKKWLFWSTLLPAFFVGCLIIGGILALFNKLDFYTLAVIFLISLFSILGFYVNYYCAYKNPGTIFLLLEIIGISLNLSATFLKLGNLALKKVLVGFPFFTLITLSWEITVLYYAYKLRKINKKMQERRLIASPIYINARSVFSTATNLEELDEQFIKLRASYDSRRAIEVLAKAYDQQKKTLKLASSSL